MRPPHLSGAWRRDSSLRNVSGGCETRGRCEWSARPESFLRGAGGSGWRYKPSIHSAVLSNRSEPSREIGSLQTMSLANLLPADARDYRGPRFVRWIAMAYLGLLTIRSLIHVIAPDGGAETIATIDTTGEGGSNIIAIFGQWGAIQLLLAALLWVLLLRYRGLTPLVVLVFLIEPVLRAIAGHLKPVEAMGTPPGAALNWVVVPVMAVLLIVSLRNGDDRSA